MHVRTSAAITRHPITPAASYLRHPRNFTYPRDQPYPQGPTTVDVVTWVPNDATTPAPHGDTDGRGAWQHASPGRSPAIPPVEPLAVVGIKIDAENYDVAIAAGLSEVLTRGKVPFVLLDFHPRQADEAAGCDGVAFVRWMVAHGYTSTSLRDDATHTPLNLASRSVLEGVIGRMHGSGGSHHLLFTHSSFDLDSALRRAW